MAKQTINLGTSANKGDGDPLRTAFDKVNDNFDEVYSLLGAEGGDTDDVVAPMLVHNDHTNITVTRDDAANKIIFSVDPYDGDITGSVFGDDSTLLVDGVNSNIPKANIEDSANWDTAFAWGNHASAGYQVAGAPHDGDIEGSVFGDDSTLLVDGINNKIVGAVDTASLRTSDNNIALGNSAGFTNQGAYGIALGFGAGDTNQGGAAISIGYTAGQTTQGNSAIAIGPNAGNTTQGIDAVAIGVQAGLTTQGQSSVAIGQDAGQATQGAESVAIGKGAGKTNQAANSIVINATGIALQNTTASSLVIKPIRSAVGTTMLMYDATTGEVTHTASPVITGDITGSVFGDDSTLLVDGINNKIVGTVETASLRTSESVIVLGNNAQSNGGQSLSIGNTAISDSYGVAIGVQTQAASYDINVGAFSGKNHITTDNGYRVAVGAFAQQNANPGDETGTGAIAIGTLAGDANQGANAVAIGRYAGRNNQAAKSIVINATDSNLENTTADSLVIKPIRSAVGTTIMMYDATTGEVTHNAVIPYPANAGVSWDGVAPTTVDGAIDRLASYTQDFAVSTDAHWADPKPTGTTDAINRLAAAIYALNGNTGI